MVAPVAPAALHPLTPGSPLYAMLKIGAIGAIVALRFVLGRKNKHGESAEVEPVEVAPPVRKPHPVSKKKKRKRRG
jgi:hypothetical protein